MILASIALLAAGDLAVAPLYEVAATPGRWFPVAVTVPAGSRGPITLRTDSARGVWIVHPAAGAWEPQVAIGAVFVGTGDGAVHAEAADGTRASAPLPVGAPSRPILAIGLDAEEARAIAAAGGAALAGAAAGRLDPFFVDAFSAVAFGSEAGRPDPVDGGDARALLGAGVPVLASVEATERIFAGSAPAGVRALARDAAIPPPADPVVSARADAVAPTILAFLDLRGPAGALLLAPLALALAAVAVRRRIGERALLVGLVTGGVGAALAAAAATRPAEELRIVVVDPGSGWSRVERLVFPSDEASFDAGRGSIARPAGPGGRLVVDDGAPRRLRVRGAASIAGGEAPPRPVRAANREELARALAPVGPGALVEARRLVGAFPGTRGGSGDALLPDPRARPSRRTRAFFELVAVGWDGYVVSEAPPEGRGAAAFVLARLPGD